MHRLGDNREVFRPNRGWRPLEIQLLPYKSLAFEEKA